MVTPIRATTLHDFQKKERRYRLRGEEPKSFKKSSRRADQGGFNHTHVPKDRLVLLFEVLDIETQEGILGTLHHVGLVARVLRRNRKYWRNWSSVRVAGSH
jgi:hypothetical protein